mmetsp:Transcript_23262/g.52244  ORF Transcript_23262/g.52244 Transcript_23262/m.52244 type:complete len:177 (-) Transcript_23262:274-804(-)|eukprot:766119-Hanusia_phi.AAC.1
MSQEDPNGRKRNVLNNEIAHYIYSCRAQGTAKPLVSSSELSLRYGITPKAVRDIWRRRTWIQATQSLWTRDEIEDYNSREHSETLSSDSHKGRGHRGASKHKNREETTTLHVEVTSRAGAASRSSMAKNVGEEKSLDAGANVLESTPRAAGGNTNESSWNEGWLMDSRIISKFLNP